jgi:LysM repeat protein
LVINGSKVIYVAKGKSLLAIATENNINLAKLLEYNELDKDGLLAADQYVFLEKKSAQGDKDFYMVKQNESLYDIAQKNGIRLHDLYAYNNLKGNENLFAGKKLFLKPFNNQVMAVQENTKGISAKMHEVQPKEGLYAISKKYGITVLQIKEWNNLSDDNLKIGQQLIISK